MPSPFPGMDPYLEREGVWHGFHQLLCARCVEALAPQVRPKYFVDLDRNVYIHELGAEERRLVGRPDAFVVKAARGDVASTVGAGSNLATAPVYTRVPQVDEERPSFLKILDRDTREVVTVVEILSPVNKASGQEQYISKRQRYLEAGVGLVEIDLLRGGRRLPLEQPLECDYCIMMVRPNDAPRIGAWPITLRDPLPPAPIPLRPGDGDAKLDLHALLNTIYDIVGYSDYIYDSDPEPPLRTEDREWARQLVALRPK